MRLRPLCCAVAAALSSVGPAAAAGPRWQGHWRDAAFGTGGRAALLTGERPVLRLEHAFGCIGPVELPLALRGRTASGRGGDVTCNRGLRWRLAGRFASRAFTAVVRLRLADGSRATLTIALRGSG